MIHVREEGEIIRTGFNFYPVSSNQRGVVIKLKNFVLFIRYNRLQRRFCCHGPYKGVE